MRRTLLPLLLVLGSWAQAETDVERSNAQAQVLIDALAEFQPEILTRLGLGDDHTRVLDLGPDRNERYRETLMVARDRLVAQLAIEENAFVREDLAILIDSANASIESSLVNERLIAPHFNVPQLIYGGVFGLLKPDGTPKHRSDALERLRNYLAIPALARARYTEAVTANPGLVRPFRAEVEQELANAPRFLAGIGALFDAPDFDAAEVAPVLEQLAAVFETHRTWVKETVLPDVRDDFRLPPEIYADNLRQVGLDIPPEALIGRAQTAYAEIRNEMRTLAPLVAAERGWDTGDYREVIRRMKLEQLTREEVIPFYKSVITRVEDIIRRERIVTLPDRPMAIRLADEAENAAQPAPHMSPPPLTGGTGDERGTFVLTSGTPPVESEAAPTFDDFTFKAGTWTLTAHEGRPGHELQFAAMVERGVSLARSYFAFNSVNVEGWALYAEAELKPYEPLDGQLIALQHRLLRAARAFLDPMINLGRISRDEAGRVLREEVALSEAMVEQELDRYTFRMPGQATSYFYGYTRLMALRTATEIALGDHFDRLAFNDFVISQGLIPPALLERAVTEQFIPAQRP